MKRISNVLGMAGILGLLGMSPLAAHGAVAYDYTPGGASLPGNQGGTAAYSLANSFVVNSPISITGLRVFDQGGNGLSGAYAAGITVSICIINTGDVGNITGGARYSDFSVNFQGTSQPYDAATGTRYQSITPLELAPGTYMVVANHMGKGTQAAEVNYNVATAGGSPAIPTDSAGGLVTYGISYYNSNPNWNNILWAGTDGWASAGTYIPAYAAGNFDFTAVPEAQHFAFAGAALLGLVFVGRNSFLRRKTIA